jgi:SAV_6107-like HEPN
MTWQQLVTSNRAKTHKTSKQEIDGLRSVVGRDLKDASAAGLSEDRRFATAYNAALQLATMTIACAGYRVSAKQGHHENTFLALELAMGNPAKKFANYFNACRKKRNLVDYNLANIVTETELQELLTQATEFQALVEDWIFDNYPQFV